MIVGSLFIGLDVLRVSLAEKREEEKQQAIAIKATRASEEVERLRLAATLEQQKKDEEAKVQKQKQELIDVSRRLATLEQQAARAAEKAADDAKLLAAAQERERQLLAGAAAAEPKRVVPPPPSGRAAVSVSGERAVPLAAQRSLSAMGIDMIACAGGTFSMGSRSGGSDEQPVTTVTLSPFWLAKTEVTQAQWEALMGSNPSHFKGGQLPVENVSWGDAMEFCRKLTERERQAGRLPTGTIYTLPTEAQWEYACRAGTTGDYAGEVDAMAWYYKNSGAATRAVGTKQANAWGLHDMHGNVLEWCLDWYGPYLGGRVTDPKSVPSGPIRVIRGGSWSYEAYYARSAYRYNIIPDLRYYSIGFRPARSSVP
jgi:formylglycine-generating enzyme required for sulfatase activity